jgi:hypothetical protein
MFISIGVMRCKCVVLVYVPERWLSGFYDGCSGILTEVVGGYAVQILYECVTVQQCTSV